jgi:hypothetical protein
MRYQPERNQRGMALVAVILMSAFILLAIVVIASMASYGGRLGTRNERLGYQALLTAESGLNTFEVRISLLTPKDRYYGALEPTKLNTWLAARGLNSLNLGDQGTATLSVEAVSGSTLTLQSSGSLPGFMGNKKTLIDMSAVRALRSPRILAALTSYVPISFSGNASSGGLDGLTSLGTYDLTTTAASVTIPASSKNPFSLEVANASLISVGSYVEIGAKSYKVVNKNNNTLGLRPAVVSSSSYTLNSGSNVALILSATAAKVTGNTFAVSDVGQFGVKDKIYIGGYEAEVTAIDPVLGKLTVSWIGSSPSNSSPINEGTPIRRYVYGALSADDIDVQGSSVVLPGLSPDDDVRLPSKDALFETTFGMTREQFLALPGLATQTTTPSVVSGVMYIDGDWSSKSICGKGIVVVKGDAKINGVCADGFQGLLYVQGDYDNQGNSVLSGAVVVEGETTTTMLGTGSGSFLKVNYDPKVLLEVGQNLSPWTFEPVSGSWRLK